MDLGKELMIPDSEVPKCPEFEVKSKIGKLFMNEKVLKGYSVKIDPYLELMPILLNIFSHRNWWTKHEGRELIFEKKDKRHYKKILVANLLELIQVMQKRVMMQIMKLVKYKHLLVNLKKKIKEKENKIKELEDEIQKLKLQLTN